MVKYRPAGLAFELGASSYSRMHQRRYEMFPLIVYLARLLLTRLLVILLHSLLTLTSLFVFGMHEILKTASDRFPSGFPTDLTVYWL